MLAATSRPLNLSLDVVEFQWRLASNLKHKDSYSMRLTSKVHEDRT